MPPCVSPPSALLIGFVMLTGLTGCASVNTVSNLIPVSENPIAPTNTDSDNIEANSSSQPAALRVDVPLEHHWSADWETAFQQRGEAAIAYYSNQDYGDTKGENEKRSYPLAMFDFLAGNRRQALTFLQSEDAQASDNQHTLGIDYYYCFTLKGQIRKYFYWGEFLDPDYRWRMFEGAEQWTAQDPNHRPHPIYGNGDGSNQGWGPQVRGGWVDGRNTDNLRAMREVAIYLMAEETGNEAVRRQYQEKLQRYVWALYHIGMGEWDSETYHGHTLAAYLNLYDFAQDSNVKKLAKAALDWLSAAGAVKYYQGGFGGPVKRDYGRSNVVFGSDAARLLWQYFGDARIDNPKPERDAIHVITSSYRPPAAVVALAQKQFDRPVELLSTKPTYENWRPGRADRPAYWETTFWGNTYQLGSVVAKFADADVGPFKLMADNSTRGVDYFVANTGGEWVRPGKQTGDQIGQYRNLMIWLRPATNTPFFFQLPQTAKSEIEDGIWFFQLEKTWLAVHPINLEAYRKVEIPDQRTAEDYRNEVTLKAENLAGQYSGFALEVGEVESHGSYADFKQAVKDRSEADLSDLAAGAVQITSVTGATLKLTHNPDNERPSLVRNDVPHHWSEHVDLYQPTDGSTPISLGWKQGRLRVEAGGFTFESTVSVDGGVAHPQLSAP